MERTIAKKDTSFGTKSKLPSIVGMKVGPTGTTKGSKSIIVWCNLEKTFCRRLKVNDFARK
jgi:hypothetical protein